MAPEALPMRIPLHDPDFYLGDPFPAYAWLRRHAPVYRNPETGWWAISRYDDVRFVSSRPELFTSTRGIMIPESGGVNPDQLGLLIFKDPPVHRSLRKLVIDSFTPARIAALEPRLREIARGLRAELRPGRALDFAEAIAAPLPTLVIAEMLGAPSEDWPRFRIWSDAVIGIEDPAQPVGIATAQAELHAYFSKLIEQRRRAPADDLISKLLAARVDGQSLSRQDVYEFCWLLLIAGNETTRNLIALGTKALLEHPEQLRQLQADPSLLPGAIEEMLRWCNPVAHMMRTATTEVEIRGQKILAGERVVMLYGAANRDEEVFGADAELFRIKRHPNRHLQFGFGEHICIGAHLSRLEARVMFEELLPLLERTALAGPVVRIRSSMVPGVRHMPVRLAA
jgi:cytochrome P450